MSALKIIVEILLLPVMFGPLWTFLFKKQLIGPSSTDPKVSAQQFSKAKIYGLVAWGVGVAAMFGEFFLLVHK